MKAETRGRPTEPNSLDSIGRALIAIDKPTRTNFKELAEAHQETLAGYLRKLAITEKAKGKQTILPGNKSMFPASVENNPVLKATDNLLQFITVKLLDDFHFAGDKQADVDSWIKMISWLGTPEYAETRRSEAETIVMLKQENAELKRQQQQLALLAPGNLEKGEAVA